jgi:S-methylmethionine-dependent homocysteine/selenocysteine methylase
MARNSLSSAASQNTGVDRNKKPKKVGCVVAGGVLAHGAVHADHHRQRHRDERGEEHHAHRHLEATEQQGADLLARQVLAEVPLHHAAGPDPVALQR